MNVAVSAIAFGIVFPAELPDKTAVAGLMLGSRYRAWPVFVGVAAGFLVHVVIAVAAGWLIGQLPRRPVEIVVAGLFLVGAVMLLRGARSDEDDDVVPSDAPTSGLRVAGMSFAIIFLAEFGDLTQIVTANLAAHYRDPVAVGIGATLGLWAVGGLAILGGRRLQSVLSLTWITRIAAAAMIVLAVVSVVSAIEG